MVPAISDSTAAILESQHAAKACASIGAAQPASVAHVFACRVSPDRSQVVALLSRSQSEAVLADVAATGRIAVVACLLPAFKTVQVKGDDAVIVDATDADQRAVAEFCVAFAEYAARHGFPREVVEAHMKAEAGDAIGIRFSPSKAFDQTPGPTAGQPLASPS